MNLVDFLAVFSVIIGVLCYFMGYHFGKSAGIRWTSKLYQDICKEVEPIEKLKESVITPGLVGHLLKLQDISELLAYIEELENRTPKIKSNE